MLSPLLCIKLGCATSIWVLVRMLQVFQCCFDLVAVIGKGGEQIASIQSETGCKVQFAPDSGGMPDRPCTLTGTAEAIM